MVDPIDPRIGPIGLPGGATGPTQPAKTADGKTFREVFNEQIGAVNKGLLDAQKAEEDLAAGRTDNVDEVFMQVKKAELNFQMLMQIRNKLMDAYDEIMRMRI